MGILIWESDNYNKSDSDLYDNIKIAGNSLWNKKLSYIIPLHCLNLISKNYGLFSNLNMLYEFYLKF